MVHKRRRRAFGDRQCGIDQTMSAAVRKASEWGGAGERTRVVAATRRQAMRGASWSQAARAKCSGWQRVFFTTLLQNEADSPLIQQRPRTQGRCFDAVYCTSR